MNLISMKNAPGYLLSSQCLRWREAELPTADTRASVLGVPTANKPGAPTVYRNPSLGRTAFGES